MKRIFLDFFAYTFNFANPIQFLQLYQLTESKTNFTWFVRSCELVL